jgi:hypothetical protein
MMAVKLMIAISLIKILEDAIPVTLDPTVDTTYMGRHVRESK